MNFHEKLQKILFLFFSEINIVKDASKKSRKQANFEILKLYHKKF